MSKYYYESDGDKNKKTHYITGEPGGDVRVDCESKSDALAILAIIKRAHENPHFRLGLMSALADVDIHDEIRSAARDLHECPHNSFASGNADGRLEAWKRISLIGDE